MNRSVLYSIIMKLTLCYITLLMYSCANGESSAEKNYYTGAIVEYGPIWNISQSPVDNIRRNVDEYLIHIKKAKEQDADIVVFPEVGLIKKNFLKNATDLKPYTTVIPDPKERVIIPCDSEEWQDVLKRLSCAAKENKIYVVANTPERYRNEANDVIYNTNIVFDRTGALIVRYRKQNIFFEPGMNNSDSQDFATFETDFGVTFGTFICFDMVVAPSSIKMLRENPNVTDIVYPTAWVSELPFRAAVQIQSGWARAYRVNLLAANYLNPAETNGGSGIYQVDGDITYSQPVTMQATMIVKQIKKIKERPTLDIIDSSTAKMVNVNTMARSHGRLETIKDAMPNYTKVLINNTIEEQKICHGTFCCTFSVRFNSIENADYYYRMIVFKGSRDYITAEMGNHEIQLCGIAACKTTAPETCGERNENLENSQVFQEISISGTFNADDNTVLIPTLTLYDLSTMKPSDYEFKVTGSEAHKTVQMRNIQEVKQLLGFSIYGLTKNAESSSSCCSVLPLIVVSVVTMFLIARICT